MDARAADSGVAPRFSKQWFRQRLANGTPVVFSDDLTKSERTLDSALIAAAISDGRPVEIENAVISGMLDVRNAEVKEVLRLVGCTLEAVQWQNTVFLKNVDLRDCRVRGEFDASGAAFSRDFDVSASVFSAGASLQSASVGRNLNAVSAEVTGTLALVEARIGGTMTLESARLKGLASFDALNVERMLDVRNTTFSGPAYLRSMKIGAVIAGHEATFEYEVTFGSTTVGNFMDFSSVGFSGPVDFDGANIGGNLNLHRSVFSDTAKFVGVRIGVQGQFQGAQFKKAADFSYMESKGAAYFSGEDDTPAAIVSDKANFGGTHFGRLVLSDARFLGEVSFAAMRVDNDLIAEGVAFGARCSFESSSIGKNAFFSGARFGGCAVFTGIKIEGRFDFLDVEPPQGRARPAAIFDHDADFTLMQVALFARFRQVTFHGRTSFERASIAGGLLCWDALFWGKASFLHANVGTSLVLDGARFSDFLDLRLSKMSALIVDAHRKSADADGVHRSEFIVLAAPTSEKPRRTVLSKVDLRGCEYDSLSAYIDPLLTAQQEFDRRPFVHLERVLRRSGNEELADDVYFRRRVIDGDRIPPTSGRYYFDRFVRLTTGYGVRPQQIIATILLTLLLGTVAFHAPGAARPKTAPTAVSGGTTTTSPRMTEAEVEAAYCAKPTPQLDWQGALWLTIQTMSPFEIPPQGGWVPAACPIGTSGMRNYYTAAMLKIVGFIFVSLAAATFTGFLRYLGSRS